MTAKSVITILLLYWLTIACEERINLSLKSQESNLLVVEGVLTNERIEHMIKLSLPYKNSDGTAQPASGAILTVTEGIHQYNLTESPAGSGRYFTDSMIAVVSTPYLLTIQYQGRQYSAQDSSVPVEPLDTLKYQEAHDPQFFTLVLNSSGPGANYVDHDIRWMNTAFCNPGQSCKGEIIFYDLKTIDVNEIYKPEKEEFDFPVGSTIIRKKYSTSQAYRAFLRGILSETEWRGNVFDVERANAPTNLSTGAIGFFAVSSVVSDTTLVVE